MEFGTMMGLLLSGLQFTAIIFVITLVARCPSACWWRLAA